MRGAGCTYNDIVDRDYDARVARTAARPIPSGQVTRGRGLDVPGRAVHRRLRGPHAVQFFTIVLGASSLLLIAVYPFTKRFTFWPQVVLGLTFKWGALVGWAAVTGSLVAGAARALCRLGAVDHRLRHHLCPPGQGGRCRSWASNRPRSGSARRRRAGSCVLCRRRACCGAWPASWRAPVSRFCWRWRWRRAAGLAGGDARHQRRRRTASRRFKSNRLVGWLLFLGLVADMAAACWHSQMPTREADCCAR